MSDIQAFEDMLRRAGVVFQRNDDDGHLRVEIHVDEATGTKNRGYLNFYGVFVFTVDGALDYVEFYE